MFRFVIATAVMALSAGHALANLLRSMLPIGLMSIAGLIVGWRIHSSVGNAPPKTCSMSTTRPSGVITTRSGAMAPRCAATMSHRQTALRRTST